MVIKKRFLFIHQQQKSKGKTNGSQKGSFGDVIDVATIKTEIK